MAVPTECVQSPSIPLHVTEERDTEKKPLCSIDPEKQKRLFYRGHPAAEPEEGRIGRFQKLASQDLVLRHDRGNVVDGEMVVAEYLKEPLQQNRYGAELLNLPHLAPDRVSVHQGRSALVCAFFRGLGPCWSSYHRLSPDSSREPDGAPGPHMRS